MVSLSVNDRLGAPGVAGKSARARRVRATPTGRGPAAQALWRSSREAAVTFVRGSPGSGKSTLLTYLAAALREQEVTVIHVHGTSVWSRDAQGCAALLSATRDCLEDLAPSARLVEAIRALSRVCETGEVPRSGEAETPHTALCKLFSALPSSGGRTVFLVDGLHTMPDADRWFRLAQRFGHAVVASSRQQAEHGVAQSYPEHRADRVIDLDPLSEEDIRDVVHAEVGKHLDPAVLARLRVELGDLWGNPGAVTSVLRELRRRDRLRTVHGYVCVRGDTEPVLLGRGHTLAERFDELGELGNRLVCLAAGDVGFGVDQLPAFARAFGRTVTECGRAVDELVRLGLLYGTTSGTLYARCPALAATVLEQADPGEVSWLHARMASALLDADTLGSLDKRRLIAHAERAGATLPSSRQLLAVLGDDTLTEGDVDLRSDRLRLLWLHRRTAAAQGPSELLRALVAAGRYRLLAELVACLAADAEHAPVTGSVKRDELVALAALAAIHTGRAVPAPVLGWLDAPAGGRAPLTLCESWFAGRTPSADEFAAAFDVLGGATDTDRRLLDTPALRGACALRDPVPVLEVTLGAAYKPPEHGPVAAYHRVRGGYADGDWNTALSAARELALTDSEDGHTKTLAALLATEMCSWLGMRAQAADWLAAAPVDGSSPALRGWVVSGLRYLARDPAGALDAGWRGYRAATVDDVTVTGLLPRLALIAVDAGDRRFAEGLLEEVDALDTAHRAAGARETRLLVRGLVERDPVWLRAAEWLVRARWWHIDLVWTCVAAATVTGDEHRWLREAFRLTREMGAEALHRSVQGMIEARGVDMPPAAPPDREFSEMECRIIDLIRRGKTNRQIAATVVISEKTVEKHLTRLFLKTSYRTRHELAAASLDGRLERVRL